MTDRPGDRARREVRLAWKEAAFANFRVLLVAIGVVVILAVAVLLQPLPLWFRSFELGALTAASVAALAWIVHIASGVHGRQLGKMGEQCSARAVLNWRRRRRGWELINGLHFKGHGDVDHVLVGPGGIFAVESKWTSKPCVVDSRGVTGVAGRDPISQATVGAKKVESLLRYGKTKLDVSVYPVVALWGPGAPSLPNGHVHVGGVLVCEGRRQHRWLKELDRGELPADSTTTAKSALRSQRDRQVDAF